MFWGLVLEPSKKYTQKVDQTFHVSQAALDYQSGNSNAKLIVEYENSSFILATLNASKGIYQVPLDLIFKTGDQVSFRIIGNEKVHLSGYHVLDFNDAVMNGEEESDLEEIEEEEEVEDEEEVELKGKGKRKKQTPNVKGNKKAKVANEEDSDLEEDEDDDDNEDEEEESPTLKKGEGKKEKGKGKGKGKNVSSLLSMEEEDDDDDDEEDDDFEMEEEEDEEELDDLEFEESDEEAEAAVKPEKKKQPQTPNGLEAASPSKEKDKSFKKLKKGKFETPEGKNKQGEGKKSNKNSENESTPQKINLETSKSSEKKGKSPKVEGSPQKKVLEGGVISEEIRVGNGPIAKPGKMVNVYYVGTLSSTKKQFDSVQNGPGFKFRLGRNEVIKGWDIGVNGMKVGGKRRLTIPPHLAYGARGSPPVIPPNSTLVFTVELKGIS